MVSTRLKLLTLSALIASLGIAPLWARDTIAITLPRHSELTPVQKLNREGVEAVKKRDYAKAESLFYKAYLYDPADPFTLNNLGFVSEMQGQLDRAHKFYQLASEQGSNANIDVSNVKQLEGQPMKTAFDSLQDVPMQVNRMNINAMRLLKEDRGSEAVALLKKALAMDARNPFTQNNLGVAEETTGDYGAAMSYYEAVADSHSTEPVIVTADQTWSGKHVSEMAAGNAQRLQRRMQNESPNESEAAMYSLRGVLAVNQNDWTTAKQDFMHAYSLDPDNAFTLNNRGFVAELDGDLESAQFFYEKAQRAGGSGDRVGIATRPLVQETSLFTLASGSDSKVNGALDIYSEERRREKAPVELIPRGSGTVSTSPDEQKQNASPDLPPPAALPTEPQPQN